MAATSAVAVTPRGRLDSIDILRGLVMVIMALDHARDLITFQTFDPMNLNKTTAVLFLTRWITHFCAPVFVFLAGTGIQLALSRGKPLAWMSRFLLTRGLWLIFLELVVIRWSWTFNLDYHFSFTQVIWVIGASMILLAGLIYVPVSVVGAIGVALVTLHNTLDPIQRTDWWWLFLLRQGVIPLSNGGIHLVAYPLLPWFGIMCCGYWFGRVFMLDESRRRAVILRIGLAATVLFAALRYTNWYGDPSKWSEQNNPLFTFLSFINCTKYPPSLLYALMTLGPALILLAFLPDRWPRIWSPFLIFGRVPMFYYLLHVPLMHVMTMIYTYVRWRRVDWLFAMPGFFPKPETIPKDFGRSLLIGYALWITAVLILYPLCRWFAAVKERNQSAWLSYL